jgi:cytoskeletal protein RodZ
MALTKTGELLKATRIKLKYTLEDVERGTRIRAKFLRALEEGDYKTFTSNAYARGFLKNYAQFLQLDTRYVLALFRRETATPNVKVLPKELLHGGSALWKVTPTRVIGLFVAILFLSVGYYFFQQYQGFLGTPSLTLEEPAEKMSVKEGNVVVSGRVDADATVLVGGKRAIFKRNSCI